MLSDVWRGSGFEIVYEGSFSERDEYCRDNLKDFMVSWMEGEGGRIVIGDFPSSECAAPSLRVTTLSRASKQSMIIASSGDWSGVRSCCKSSMSSMVCSLKWPLIDVSKSLRSLSRCTVLDSSNSHLQGLDHHLECPRAILHVRLEPFNLDRRVGESPASAPERAIPTPGQNGVDELADVTARPNDPGE